MNQESNFEPDEYIINDFPQLSPSPIPSPINEHDHSNYNPFRYQLPWVNEENEPRTLWNFLQSPELPEPTSSNANVTIDHQPYPFLGGLYPPLPIEPSLPQYPRLPSPSPAPIDHINEVLEHPFDIGQPSSSSALLPPPTTTEQNRSNVGPIRRLRPRLTRAIPVAGIPEDLQPSFQATPQVPQPTPTGIEIAAPTLPLDWTACQCPNKGKKPARHFRTVCPYNTHRDEIKCTVCDETFNRLDNMKRHRWRNHRV